MIAPQTLALDGNRIAYRTCGSGPDVLMIHGWVSSGLVWEGVIVAGGLISGLFTLILRQGARSNGVRYE